MKVAIAAGTQRAVAILNDTSLEVIEELQSWFDDGWRCVALVNSDDGETIIAVIEAGPDAKDEPDDQDPEPSRPSTDG